VKVQYEKPKDYDKVRCDKCHKYIKAASGFLHCEKCGEDHCVDCAYLRCDMSDKKIQKLQIFVGGIGR